MIDDLKIGDVVQIDPELEDSFFAGCFMLVTEPKPWGAQGFVAMPGERGSPPKRAYVRVKREHLAYIGTAGWVPADEIEAES